MKFRLVSLICSSILLALFINQPAHAQDATISSTANDVNWAFAQINNLDRKVVEAPVVKQSAKVLAAKRELLANIAAANITLDPAVVALLPAGELLPEKDKANISVVAGLPRPDVRRIVVVLKREGATYPYVTDIILPATGLKQFEPVEVYSDVLPGAGNYAVWIFSLAENRAYLEAVRTRLYSGYIEHADDEKGMRLTQFTTTFTGAGWYATLKGRSLGLRTLVAITYFGLVVPFRVYPVLSSNGDSEDNFSLPFSVSEPFSDVTLRCDITIQKLDDLTFEAVIRRQFASLRTRYVPQQ